MMGIVFSQRAGKCIGYELAAGCVRMDRGTDRFSITVGRGNGVGGDADGAHLGCSRYAGKAACRHGVGVTALPRWARPINLGPIYHGKSEYGRDLIFAEVDRFGNVRYHALQAKYEASISLNGAQDLINDAHQAFSNPFKHPQTGTKEYISTFYAANGGTLSEQAVSHYFNSLRATYFGNVQLLQGKDLLVLDRWAAIKRNERIGEQLTGLLMELRYNETVLVQIENMLGTPANSMPDRLRDRAVADYMRRPLVSDVINVDTVSDYWHLVALVNSMLNQMVGLMVVPFVQSQKAKIRTAIQGIRRRIVELRVGITNVLSTLAPITES